jgi:hypothetical protein
VAGSCDHGDGLSGSGATGLMFVCFPKVCIFASIGILNIYIRILVR